MHPSFPAEGSSCNKMRTATFTPMHTFLRLSLLWNRIMTSMIASYSPSSMLSITGDTTSRELNTLSLFSLITRIWLTSVSPRNCLTNKCAGWCFYRTSTSPSFTPLAWLWDPLMPFPNFLIPTLPLIMLTSPSYWMIFLFEPLTLSLLTKSLPHLLLTPSFLMLSSTSTTAPPFLLRYEAQTFFFLSSTLPLLRLIHRWPLLLPLLSSPTFIDIRHSSRIPLPWFRQPSFTFYGCISPKAMTHHLVPPLTHPSMTFHHVPESGPCAYPRSTNTVLFCNNNSKLGLLSACSQSSFLI